MFTIEKKLKGKLGRAGKLETAHGVIETPAFVTVGTKATVKALTPEQIKETGAQVVLGNTYHLYLEPGEKIVEQAGGIGKFMGWDGPTMTDSGGFQVFSLGAAFGKSIGKVANLIPPLLKEVPSRRGGGFSNPSCEDAVLPTEAVHLSHPKTYAQGLAKLQVFASHPLEKGESETSAPLVKIDEDGVTFKSYKDGSEHRFTPERSIEIQHAIGADIIFAFDECTSPDASKEYQREAMERTHRWARRSLERHLQFTPTTPSSKTTTLRTGAVHLSHPKTDAQGLAKLQVFASHLLRQEGMKNRQMLFGITQGGRYEDLRKESARVIGKMDFDGFGIGGSFDKEDMGNAVRWVNELLPEEKPKHLLGIGDPGDLFEAVENGCDLFDCVAPTRQARNGSLYIKNGRLNITNTAYRSDFSPIEADCGCYTCLPRESGGAGFTRAYLSHLFRSDEILANTLASVHNVYFIVQLVKKMRQGILEGTFSKFKKDFLASYKK